MGTCPGTQQAWGTPTLSLGHADPPPSPCSPLPPRRSLELLFASGQNNKLLYGDPPKSPRATRKFSSPPPLSLTTKTASPSRRRKLSLNIPIITGGKALDLAALGCGSNGYSPVYSAVAPLGKAALDTGKLCMSGGFASKISDEAEAAAEKPDEPSAPGKQSAWHMGPAPLLGGPPSPWGVVSTGDASRARPQSPPD